MSPPSPRLRPPGYTRTVLTVLDGVVAGEGEGPLAPHDVPLAGALSLDARVGGTLTQLEPEGRLTLTDTRVVDSTAADSSVTTLRLRQALICRSNA